MKMNDRRIPRVCGRTIWTDPPEFKLRRSELNPPSPRLRRASPPTEARNTPGPYARFLRKIPASFSIPCITYSHKFVFLLFALIRIFQPKTEAHTSAYAEIQTSVSGRLLYSY